MRMPRQIYIVTRKKFLKNIIKREIIYNSEFLIDEKISENGLRLD